ncbi:hypothetical protein BJX62DRAFT_199457 [Aspergillus germanicus]
MYSYLRIHALLALLSLVHDEYYSVLFSSFPSCRQPKFQDCERDAKTRLARLARPSQLLGGWVLAWTCAGSFLRLASFRNMLLIRLTVHPFSWRCNTANFASLTSQSQTLQELIDRDAQPSFTPGLDLPIICHCQERSGT